MSHTFKEYMYWLVLNEYCKWGIKRVRLLFHSKIKCVAKVFYVFVTGDSLTSYVTYF